MRAWLRYVYLNRPIVLMRAVLWKMAPLLLVGAALRTFVYNAVWPGYDLVPIVLFALGMVTYDFVTYPKNVGDDKDTWSIPYEITLHPDGLREASIVEDTFIAWRLIKSIEATDKYIFLTRAHDRAYIVPASAFPTLDEAVQFRDTAMHFHEQALAGPVPVLV